MKFDPKIHHRRSIRLKGYDYTQPGAYFVTMVTLHHEHLFGEIVGDEMHQNEFGSIVVETWQWLESQYPYIELGASVVMPNHFHGIVIINSIDPCRGGSRPAPTDELRPAPTIGKIKPLGQVIGAFKTVSAKHVNILRNTPGKSVWQRDFFEHIIRDEKDWKRIHEYIEANPSNWKEDEENW